MSVMLLFVCVCVFFFLQLKVLELATVQFFLYIIYN